MSHITLTTTERVKTELANKVDIPTDPIEKETWVEERQSKIRKALIMDALLNYSGPKPETNKNDNECNKKASGPS